MEVRWDVFLAIAGASLVTLLPRVVPLMLLSRLSLPDWLTRWLHYVPVSVMAALVGQALFFPEGEAVGSTGNLALYTAIPSFLVAIKTRSILATVSTGIVVLMMLRLLFPGM